MGSSKTSFTIGVVFQLGSLFRKVCHPGNLKHIQANPRVFKALIQLLGKIAEDSWSRPASAFHSPRLNSLRVKCLQSNQHKKSKTPWAENTSVNTLEAQQWFTSYQYVTSSLFVPFIILNLDSLQCWRIWRPICQAAEVWLQWQASLQKPQRCAAAIPGRPSLTCAMRLPTPWQNMTKTPLSFDIYANANMKDDIQKNVEAPVNLQKGPHT